MIWRSFSFTYFLYDNLLSRLSRNTGQNVTDSMSSSMKPPSSISVIVLRSFNRDFCWEFNFNSFPNGGKFRNYPFYGQFQHELLRFLVRFFFLLPLQARFQALLKYARGTAFIRNSFYYRQNFRSLI